METEPQPDKTEPTPRVNLAIIIFIYCCDDGFVGISRAKTMRLCSTWRNVSASDKTN